jgi:hypothetical protein
LYTDLSHWSCAFASEQLRSNRDRCSFLCHCKLSCYLLQVDYKSVSIQHWIVQVLINQLYVHFVHLMRSPIQSIILHCLLAALPFTVHNSKEAWGWHMRKTYLCNLQYEKEQTLPFMLLQQPAAHQSALNQPT